MVRLVLIAAALSACYIPDVRDCVDTCGTSGLCPGGTSCSDEGFCRPPEATGTCKDMGMCPPVPMMQGCMNAMPNPAVAPNCFVVCAQTVSATDAASAQPSNFMSWHLAVITDLDQETAAITALGGRTAWLGLTQQPGQLTPAAGWQWSAATAVNYTAWSSPPDDGDGTENDLENCGALTTAGWIDEPCATLHPFLVQSTSAP